MKDYDYLRVFLCRNCHQAFLEAVWDSEDGKCENCGSRRRVLVKDSNIDKLQFANPLQKESAKRLLHFTFLPLHGGIQVGDTIEYYLDSRSVVGYNRHEDDATLSAVKRNQHAGCIMDS